MIAFDLSPAATDACVKLGLSADFPRWWGVLPAIKRTDAALNVFSDERRAQLDALTRRSEADPTSLTMRDHAAYAGLLAETVAVVSASVAGGAT